jgi:hypothetical protein
MRRGEFDRVMQTLEEHPDLITSKHSQKGTLLFRALGRRGNVLAKYLLERGADPNATSYWGGFTPLASCVEMAGSLDLPQPEGVVVSCDYLGAVELLLAHGADPNRARFPLGIHLAAGHPKQQSESLLEGGERLQRSKFDHSTKRNAVMACVRDHLGLPVDAMLPLNAPSFYRDISAEDSSKR